MGGEGRERLFTPHAFPGGTLLQILVDQRDQKGITPEIKVLIVWDSLFLWEVEIMALKI